MKRTPLKRGKSQLKRTRLKPVSAKRAKRDASYREARRQLLEEHPECVYRFDGCTRVATDADHIVPRGLAPDRVDDITNLNSACRSCHEYRHNRLTREERKALGLGIYGNKPTT